MSSLREELAKKLLELVNDGIIDCSKLSRQSGVLTLRWYWGLALPVLLKKLNDSILNPTEEIETRVWQEDRYVTAISIRNSLTQPKKIIYTQVVPPYHKKKL